MHERILSLDFANKYFLKILLDMCLYFLHVLCNYMITFQQLQQGWGLMLSWTWQPVLKQIWDSSNEYQTSSTAIFGLYPLILLACNLLEAQPWAGT